MSTISRTELHRLIDELPEPVMAEVAQFVEFVHFKLEKETKRLETYTPVALGGLWHGLTIKDEDIAAVRQEMFENFGQSSE